MGRRGLGRANVVRRTLSHFVYIGRNQTQEAKAEHIFPHRGRLIIKDFELSTKFPFGFFNHRRRLPARETELIVFPRLVPFSDRLDDTPLNTGQITAYKRGAGQDLLASAITGQMTIFEVLTGRRRLVSRR